MAYGLKASSCDPLILRYVNVNVRELQKTLVKIVDSFKHRLWFNTPNPSKSPKNLIEKM